MDKTFKFRPWCLMALPFMEFQDQGYKIRNIFVKKSTYQKGNHWILRIGLMGSLSSLQKSEFLKLLISFFHYFWCQNWDQWHKIDATDMVVTQPIWLTGCPKEDLFMAKNAFLALIQFFSDFHNCFKIENWWVWKKYHFLNPRILNFFLFHPRWNQAQILG